MTDTSARRRRLRGTLTSLFLAVSAVLPLSVSPGLAQSLAPQEKVEMAVNNTYMGYIVTGNPSLDPVTEAGLNGLGYMLNQYTSVQNIVTDPSANVGRTPVQAAPLRAMGLDIERDDLSLYPVIYWAVDPLQADFSAAAIAKLNDYTANGGMLIIDTRDGNQANGRGMQKVRRMADLGLNIPPLVRVKGCETKPCNLLGRSYYMLEDFPGRERGADVWMENASELRHDGVPSVVLGHNDWAGAWAIDGSGRYILSVPEAGEQRKYAYRVGINLVMMALTGRYKDDPVHTEQIYQRIPS